MKRNRKGYYRQWYLDHRDSEIQKAKERQRKNKEKHNEYNRKYSKSQKGRSYHNNYRKTPKGKEMESRHKHKRKRNLKFIPVNSWHEGREAHHLNDIYVIYVPISLHRSIRHSLNNRESMEEINSVLIKWYFEYD